MACLYDSGDWIKWQTITLTLRLSGAYTYNFNQSTWSGEILDATSTAILTRVPFDRTKEPTHSGQGLANDEFTSYRARRGCPVLLLPSYPINGEGDFTLETHYVPGPFGSGSATDTEEIVAAEFELIFIDKSGCDCGDPASDLQIGNGIAPFVDYDRFIVAVEIPFDPSVFFAWDSPNSISEEIEYDISTPPGYEPQPTCGEGTAKLTIATT